MKFLSESLHVPWHLSTVALRRALGGLVSALLAAQIFLTLQLQFYCVCHNHPWTSASSFLLTDFILFTCSSLAMLELSHMEMDLSVGASHVFWFHSPTPPVVTCLRASASVNMHGFYQWQIFCFQHHSRSDSDFQNNFSLHFQLLHPSTASRLTHLLLPSAPPPWHCGDSPLPHRCMTSSSRASAAAHSYSTLLISVIISFSLKALHEFVFLKTIPLKALSVMRQNTLVLVRMILNTFALGQEWANFLTRGPQLS